MATGEKTLTDLEGAGKVFSGFLAADDLIHGVDISDITDSAGGTSKAWSPANLGLTTLGEYEKGVFSPEITYSVTPPDSIAYVAQSGHYIQNGDMVTVWIGIVLSAFTKGAGAGELIASNLPFAAVDVNAIAPVLTRLAPFTSQPVGFVSANNVSLLRPITNANWVSLDDPDADSEYYLTFSYKIS